jgi:hypothetical protein
MTQMEIRPGSMQDIARELGASLPESATITSYVLVFGSAVATDRGALEERQTIITSQGLSHAARIELLEGALAFERAQADDN